MVYTSVESMSEVTPLVLVSRSGWISLLRFARNVEESNTLDSMAKAGGCAKQLKPVIYIFISDESY